VTRAVAVTGKGGVGKTTVAALMIRHLTQSGRGPVLAIDADADANLGTLLGLEARQTVGDLREEVQRAMRCVRPARVQSARVAQEGFVSGLLRLQGWWLTVRIAASRLPLVALASREPVVAELDRRRQCPCRPAHFDNHAWRSRFLCGVGP